jgi:hypothetical protein
LFPQGHLSSLAELCLGRCAFTGPVPAAWGKLGRLAILGLEENALEVTRR